MTTGNYPPELAVSPSEEARLTMETSSERAAHEHYQEAGHYLAKLGIDHLGSTPRRRDMLHSNLGTMALHPFSTFQAMRHIGLAQEQLRIKAVISGNQSEF